MASPWRDSSDLGVADKEEGGGSAVANSPNAAEARSHARVSKEVWRLSEGKRWGGSVVECRVEEEGLIGGGTGGRGFKPLRDVRAAPRGTRPLGRAGANPSHKAPKLVPAGGAPRQWGRV
jgi:hypothetical protein